MMYPDLKDRVAVVTGGAGVIGSSVVVSLARSGCLVAVCDLDGEKAQALAGYMESTYGVRSRGYACDVLSKESLLDVASVVESELGVVNLLVNGVGGNAPCATTSVELLEEQDGTVNFDGSFFSLAEEGFRSVLDLNLLGTVLPSQVWGRTMVEQGGGSIVNVASTNVFRPLTRIPAYSAAKCAVKNFTEWLAGHLAKSDVRVNAVAPGFILTEQLMFLAFDEKGQLTERYRKVLANTPMGRFGEPEELVGTFLFLLSMQSSFVTGVTLPVDGGFSCFGGV